MDKYKAFLEELGSSIAHRNVLTRGIARRVLQLTEPSDRLLRWRRGRITQQATWAKADGRQQDAGLNPANWPDAIVGVNRYVMGGDLTELAGQDGGHRPAVAYRLGTLIMVGVQEVGKEGGNFVAPLNAQGDFDKEGAYAGVVMRTGPGFEGAIGVAFNSGRVFLPLDTTILAQVEQTPPNLLRV